MNDELIIGSNPLPLKAQYDLNKFISRLEETYDIKGGATALYWYLSFELSKVIQSKDKQTKTVALGDSAASFDDVFAAARNAGVDEFDWRGKRYHTLLIDECSPTKRNPILNIVEE